MTRADLDYLIEGIVSGLGGRGGLGASSSSSSYGRSGISVEDFKREDSRHKDRMSEMEERNYGEINKYLKEKKRLQEKINESQQAQLKIQEKLNSEYSDGEELLERIQNGTASDEDKERAEEMLQLQREKNKALEDEYAIQQKLNNSNFFGSAVRQISGVINGIKSIARGMENLMTPWTKIDAAASKYVKTLGMTKSAMDELSKRTLYNVSNRQIAQKYGGILPSDIIEAQIDYIKGAGRKISINEDEQESIAALKFIGGNSAIDFAAQLERFGVSLKGAEKHYGRMFSTASKQGINLEKYTENVAKNIKIAQNYTIKNGLKGLEEMAKKATVMKMDMQQVANFADKVMTVEGAIDVASRLQVLGGSFAEMADPIGLMHDAMYDMEGLSDRIITMISNKGYYDKANGQFTVDTGDKLRIRQMADITGFSYDNLMEQAYAKARRDAISSAIESSSIASGFDDDLKELIKNTGTYENDKAGINIEGDFIELENINADHQKYLIAASKTDTENLRTIAVSVKSIDDKMKGMKAAVEVKQAMAMKGPAEFYGNVLDYLSKFEWILWILAGAGIVGGAASIVGGVGNMMGGFRGTAGRPPVGGTPNVMPTGPATPVGPKPTGAPGAPAGPKPTVTPVGPTTTPKPTTPTTSVWGSIKGFFSKIGNTAKSLIGTVGGFFVTCSGKITDMVGKAGGWLSNAWGQVKNVAGKAGGWFSKVAKQAGGWLSNAWGQVKNVAGKAGGWFSKVTKQAGGWFSKIGGQVGKWASKNWGKAAGWISKNWGKATGWLSKYGTKIGANISKNPLKLGKGGGVGIIGAVGDIGTDILVDEGVIEKGGVGHYTAKILSNAAAYGGLGAQLGGGYGAGIGVVYGAWDGAWEADKARYQKYVENQGLTNLNGDYGRWDYIHMHEALSGEKSLSYNDRRMLEKNGDHEVLKKIEENKNQRDSVALEAYIKSMEKINPTYAAKMRAQQAGLIKADPIKFWHTPQEMMSYEDYIKINPIPTTGNSSIPTSTNNGNKEIHIKTDPQDIKLNGTLNLKGQDGKSIDIIDTLSKDKVLLTHLSSMVSNEIKRMGHGSDVSREF